MTKKEPDHPCKITCSGWQQGYEKGNEAAFLDIRSQLPNFHACPEWDEMFIWKGLPEMEACSCFNSRHSPRS